MSFPSLLLKLISVILLSKLIFYKDLLLDKFCLQFTALHMIAN